MTVENRAAIVTGGAHGLGRAIALRLADDGADVMVADVLGADAEVVAESVRAKGRRAASFEVDVSDSGAVGAMVMAAVEAFGHVDLLVNNAGVSGEAGLLEMEEAHWDRIMGVNLKGNFLCSQAVAREMVARGEGGRIINITSTAGANARPRASAYGASDPLRRASNDRRSAFKCHFAPPKSLTAHRQLASRVAAVHEDNLSVDVRRVRRRQERHRGGNV